MVVCRSTAIAAGSKSPSEADQGATGCSELAKEGPGPPPAIHGHEVFVCEGLGAGALCLESECEQHGFSHPDMMDAEHEVAAQALDDHEGRKAPSTNKSASVNRVALAKSREFRTAWHSNVRNTN